MEIIDRSRDSHLERAKENAWAKSARPAQIAAEHSMLAYINGQPAPGLICTPEYLDELVLGRLLTEGLIRRTEDVERIFIGEGGLRAEITLRPEALGRQAEPDADRSAAVPARPENAWLQSMAEKTEAEQSLYGATHASHACCLFRADRLLCCREDIGRHNALDKDFGWTLKSGEDLSSCMLYTTGRLPADMVRKAVRAGVPLLASKTFPTDQGIEAARQARLTLVTVRPDGTVTVWNDGQK